MTSQKAQQAQQEHGAVAAATAALEQLQLQHPALFGLFVQQQLLVAQSLLATAGSVLSRPLPRLPQQPELSSPAVSAH